MNILLTNLSFHATNDIIKEIRRGKYSKSILVGTSIYPYGYTSASLFVDEFIRQPSYYPEKDYVEFIIKTCRKYNIDLIFAIDEDEIKILSHYVNSIPAKLILPRFEIINMFCDKKCANDNISSLNIDIPKYILTNADLQNIANGKIITRKRVSCASLGIKIYDTSNIQDISLLSNANNIIQEYINGTEYCVDVFCDNSGTPKLIVPRKRIAIRGGTTHKCLIEKNEPLISLCKKICEAFVLPGLSNMQFIVENNSNKVFFLEVNPRIGATTIATSMSSVNLIELFIDHFCFGENLKDLTFYMDKVKWGSFISRYYCETICESYENE